MATKIISHLKLLVPEINEPPRELMDEFVKGLLDAKPKTYRRLKQALPDAEAVITKMIKPSRLGGTQSLFNPDFVTRSGLDIKDVMTVSEAVIETWARRYLKKIQYAFQDDKELDTKIKFKAVYYLNEMARQVLPFQGYQDKVRGVGPIGARWLTGDESVLALLKSADIIIKGPPVDITRSGQKPRFRGRFINQIVSAGGQIVKTHYLPDQIAKGNVKINRLVNQYAADRFVPFTLGGASHVDFISEPGHLFLDIQVSTR
jgi:hypothetical protein